jgi:ribonuclease HI
MEQEVMIYTDGACLENPGSGGYGVVLSYGKHKKELSGGFDFTTNNRMEMMAAIVGLESLQRPCQVKLYSDSRYLVDAITKGWAQKWRNNNWWRNKTEKALNPDLWERLLDLCDKRQVEFTWIKGHAGHTENERCDELATRAAKQEELPEDEGYDPDAISGKIKITAEGEPCRKCSTPVIKKIPSTIQKENQTYYYEYYLYCPDCKRMYMVEDAKREISTPE